MRGRAGELSILNLAVVIPALNEESNIQRALDSVAGAGVAQVIVVDGGSTDGTVRIAQRAGAKVVRSHTGRGPQLNAGWRAAGKADWCLFLHADSELPAGFDGLLLDALRPQQQQPAGRAPPCWGCFRSIRLTQVPTWQTRLVEACVGLRTQLLRLPYGDQALFVRRATLERCQGFADWGLLEDLDLVRRLNRVSPPAVLPASVTTSGRRYQAGGFWETLLVHQAILLGWAVGVPPPQLAKWREAVRARR